MRQRQSCEQMPWSWVSSRRTSLEFNTEQRAMTASSSVRCFESGADFAEAAKWVWEGSRPRGCRLSLSMASEASPCVRTEDVERKGRGETSVSTQHSSTIADRSHAMGYMHEDEEGQSKEGRHLDTVLIC